MALRTILVHLDVRERAASRVAAAAALALQHEAHLVGVAPTGWVTMPVDVTGTLANEAFDAAMSLLREQAAQAAQRFEAQASALGVSSYESRVEAADVASSMTLNARYCDLTVVTQVEPGQWVTTQSPLMPQDVLLHSGRPLLVLPYAGDSAMPPAGKALVGWDAGREAAVALKDALPLLQRMRSVEVAVFETPEDVDRRHGDLPGAAIATWLARHGVQVEVVHVPTRMSAGEALLSHAADVQAELIVVGGYGHSRFRETVLGGVTRTLLRSSPVPVLLSH